MRIMVVDDHEIVREGLVATLSSNPRHKVVGAASSGAQALAVAPRTRPELALIDLRLPDMKGDELCRQLLEANPGLLVVILTTYLSEEAVRGALRAGAAGYVTKAAGLRVLRETIDALRWPAEDARNALQIVKQLHQQEERRMGTSRPTPQQERVLELAAQGLTNRQVGEQMFISESTVRFHIQKLKGLLGARTRTELIAKAIRTGTIESAPEDMTAAR